jgi:hypothetical protein
VVNFPLCPITNNYTSQGLVCLNIFSGLISALGNSFLHDLLQHGVLATEKGRLFIEPTSHAEGMSGDGRQHTISKSSGTPHPSSGCTTPVDESSPSPHTPDSDAVGEVKRRKRLITAPESYVETVVVADETMLQFHSEENLEAYIFTIMNIVSSLGTLQGVGVESACAVSVTHVQ